MFKGRQGMVDTGYGCLEGAITRIPGYLGKVVPHVLRVPRYLVKAIREVLEAPEVPGYS